MRRALMLGAENGLGRTTANSAAGWFVTRYSLKKSAFKQASSAGNLAGKNPA
jgi:hypothetical protein